jgi:hypothetical protein
VFHALAALGVLPAGSSTPARHALFVLINLAAAAGVWRRPRGFVWLFAALTAQQLYSHGSDAWREHAAGASIDPASLVVLVGMPLVLFALAWDARSRRV